MPAYTRSKLATKCSSKCASKPATKCESDVVVRRSRRLVGKPCTKSSMIHDIYAENLVSVLDSIPELYEFRNPYSNCDSVVYEIPYGVFFARFGLKWGEVQALAGTTVESIGECKYVRICV